jgi:hypothetical protein
MESSKKESNNKKGLKEEESDKNPQQSKGKPTKRYISSPTSSSSDDEKKKAQREKSKRKKKNEGLPIDSFENEAFIKFEKIFNYSKKLKAKKSHQNQMHSWIKQKNWNYQSMKQSTLTFKFQF